MTTKQQREALDYFRAHAEDWRAKAEGDGSRAVNVIEQRNDYVLQVAAERAALRASLDVGCGTGELVCELARREVDATGVDYSPEMIALAAAKAQASGLSGAHFVTSSIFEFAMETGRYDLISANGFIEYISTHELQRFCDRVADALSPGGSFVLGSRNRLFNLVSMNAFTLQEADAGSVDLLIREAAAWTAARDVASLSNVAPPPLQPPESEHAHTGIDVATRLQYTPVQLIEMLRQRGLKTIEVYPIHVHGVTPAFGHIHPDVHASIANVLQGFARHGTALLPQASSFMVHARKEG